MARQMALPMEWDAQALPAMAEDLGRPGRLEEWLREKGDPEHVLTRAISVREPWLRLIMFEEKWWEFRSRPHGRPGWTIALHASRKPEREWRAILRDMDLPADTPGPLGAFCAAATLGRCIAVGGDEEQALPIDHPIPADHPGRPRPGDPLRFGWELLDLKLLEAPLEWKGQLGVWDVPEAAREIMLERLVV